jgi:hypothetical protein
MASFAPQRECEMLRIERDHDECVARLRLSGRIQSEFLVCVRSAMNDGCARKILDLSEVTLVDLEVIRFLRRRAGNVRVEGKKGSDCSRRSPPSSRSVVRRGMETNTAREIVRLDDVL